MQFRFTLSSITVNPQNFGQCSKKYEKENEEIFFRESFNGELIFVDEDFTIFKTAYDDNQLCTNYEILIEKKCSADWIVDWIGYFLLIDGKFDFTNCTYTVTPKKYDKYNCLIKNKEVKVNILNVGSETVNSPTTSFYLFFNLFLSPPVTYLPLTIDVKCYEYLTSTPVTFYHIATRYIYYPEFETGVNVGIYAAEIKYLPIYATIAGTWTYLVSNDYYKIYWRNWNTFNTTPSDDELLVWPVSTDGIYEDPNEIGYIGHYTMVYKNLGVVIWAKSSWYSGVKLDTINRIDYKAVNLNKVIRYILNKLCPEDFDLNQAFESDFFLNATNPVTGDPSCTNNIYLIQNSDANDPFASNPATIGEITFLDLMTWLRVMYQVYWDISDLGIFQLKHISEIVGGIGIDLINHPEVEGLSSISWNVDELYEKEKLIMQDKGGNDFIGLPITYNLNCTNENIKEYLCSCITDLAYVQIKPDIEPYTISSDIYLYILGTYPPEYITIAGIIATCERKSFDVPSEGFIMVSTDGGSPIISVNIEVGRITMYNAQINGHLSVANLMYHYWMHNRVLIEGNMNNSDETFLSSQKQKVFNEIEIILNEEFDPKDYITTTLGNADVKEASYNWNTNTLKLNLKL
jgi:hypothetical protein